ncbi:RlmE family RNA methyltransferase [Patescibacteria group bacterium]|nr:RlmE family RNA methyltransferase [Patescibacteria group bacterium]MBU1016321.1 RlmE family RNA methyltransferase [Patescibacteria group bacterium]MBU1685024.1 RlmE family RNA methyltransferase [Patescibacteria group bacterium]MBU1938832.1 RlmE family RNA methyltransferase [Patescibacteria group bacterium]
MTKYQSQDKFFKKAKEEGYRARSVFKLQAIDERYHLLRPGMKVLDLGAAPGSFLQYIGEKIGERGVGIGIDLQKIEDLKLVNVKTYQGDIFDEELYKKIVRENGLDKFDLITSDLAPKTTGIPFVDGGASLDLNLQVLEVVAKYLRRGGGLVMKILPGFNEGDLIGEARKIFRVIRKYRPQAVRKSSGESYIVCLKKS